MKNELGDVVGRPIEWPTVLLIIACYAAWAVAGLLLWPAYPIIALLVLGVCLALQSSLMHEVLHGHPTRNALGQRSCWSFLPIGLV